jgi:hypothetical protein
MPNIKILTNLKKSRCQKISINDENCIELNYSFDEQDLNIINNIRSNLLYID